MTMTNFRLETDADGIATLTWDMPDRSMNVITPEVMADLNTAIDTIVADPAIKGCVITSGKELFPAAPTSTCSRDLAASYAKLAKTKGEEEAMRFFFEESRKLTLLFRSSRPAASPSPPPSTASALAARSNWLCRASCASARMRNRTASACPRSRSGCSRRWRHAARRSPDADR